MGAPRLNVHKLHFVCHCFEVRLHRQACYELSSRVRQLTPGRVSGSLEVHPDGKPQQAVHRHPAGPASSQWDHPHHRPANHKHSDRQDSSRRAGEWNSSSSSSSLSSSSTSYLFLLPFLCLIFFLSPTSSSSSSSNLLLLIFFFSPSSSSYLLIPFFLLLLLIFFIFFFLCAVCWFNDRRDSDQGRQIQPLPVAGRCEYFLLDVHRWLGTFPSEKKSVDRCWSGRWSRPDSPLPNADCPITA